MSRTAAIVGAGSSLTNSSTSGGTYTAVAEVTDVKIPESMVAKVEATNYASPSNAKEFVLIPWREHSDIEVELNFTKAMVTTIYGLELVESWWKVVLPDGSLWNFPGFIGKFGGETPNQGKVSMKASITVTGAVTYTPAA